VFYAVKLSEEISAGKWCVSSIITYATLKREICIFCVYLDYDDTIVYRFSYCTECKLRLGLNNHMKGFLVLPGIIFRKKFGISCIWEKRLILKQLKACIMKKETSTLSKKIKGYSTLAGSLLAISQIAEGQIVYTDVTDTTVTGNGASYDLDLNNDGSTDYSFGISTNGGAGVKMAANALNNNAIAGTFNANYPYIYPSALDLNDIIGPDKTWNEGAGQTMASSGYFAGAYGKWFGQTDKYLALRLDMGGSNHYGWARLDVSADGKSLTVKEYAYESTAATEIAAGETGGVGINTPVENLMNVFAGEKQIFVQLNKDYSGQIVISNLIGQQIRAAEITGSMTTVNMEGQPSGVYLVSVDQNGARFTKKVSLQ
jgi:hypothetical protein